MKFTSYASSSAGNLYELETSQGRLLLEAGLPIRNIRKKVNLSGLLGVLVTHYHGDHAKGAADLAKSGHRIYATPETIDRAGCTGTPLKIGKWQFIGDTTICVYPFATKHLNSDGSDVDGACGYLVKDGPEVLLFATDTCIIPVRYPSITIAAIECNFILDVVDDAIDAGHTHPAQRPRLLRSHMSLRAAKDYLRKIDKTGLREVHLLHLSDGHSDEKKIKKEVQAVTGVPVYVCKKGGRR